MTMFRRAVLALGGLLVLFHAWLLATQVWDGQLAEPGLVLRWLVAAGLAAALDGLRRRGASMFWGRQAVAIWLLAALLHGPAMVARAGAHDSPALPEAVTILVQVAAASAALGLGLLVVAALAGRAPRRGLAVIRIAAARPRRPLDAAHLVRFAPRPPPFAPSHVLA